MTKQPLIGTDLTPNHTLRRVIQGWCCVNAEHGAERVRSPKGEGDGGHVVKVILKEAMRGRSSRLECLNKLEAFLAETERNKIYLQASIHTI